MKEYNVNFYFSEEDSEVIAIYATSLKEAVKNVSTWIEDKKILVKEGSNHEWGYNFGNVTKFHVSEK